MINFLLGAPGAGKSYEAVVYHILPAIMSGRMVLTNLPLNIDSFESIEPGSSSLIRIIENRAGYFAFSHVDDYKIEWRDNNNRGPLIVIDECHKALPRTGTNKLLEEFLAEHRHAGIDILLITQSYGKVSRVVVDMIQVVWRCRKNIALGSSSTYVRKTIDGVRGAEVSTVVRHYKKQYFQLYKSHTASNGSVIEADANQIKSIWSHWSFYGAAACCVFALYALSSGWFNPFPEPLAATVPHRTVVSPVPPYSPPTSPVSLPQSVDKVATKHPFQRLGIHAAGTITSSDESRRLSVFVLSQNGQSVFTLTSLEIIDSGYSLYRVSDCAWFIKYADWSDVITCDSPRIGIDPVSSFQGSAAGGAPVSGGAQPPTPDVPVTRLTK